MTMNSTRIYQDRRFRFLGACAVAGAALLWFMPETQEAEAKLQSIAEVAEPEIDLTRDDLYLVSHPIMTEAKTLTLKSGDSLGPLLQKNGFEPGEAYQITESFSSVYDPRKLRAGQKFNLYYEDDAFTHMTYKPSLEKTVYISRTDDNSFEARDITAEFKMETVALKATIENSIYLDANSLGACQYLRIFRRLSARYSARR